MRIVPSGAMNGSAPAISPGRTGSSAKSECSARKAATSSSPSAGSSEQLEKTTRPPTLHHAHGAGEQPLLQVRQLGDVLGALRPGNVGMTPHGAGRRARGIEQHRIEQLGRLVFQRIGFDRRGLQPQSLKVFAEAPQPVPRRIRLPSPRRRQARAARSCRRAPRKGRRRFARRGCRAALPAGLRPRPGPTIRRPHIPAVRRPARRDVRFGWTRSAARRRRTPRPSAADRISR